MKKKGRPGRISAAAVARLRADLQDATLWPAYRQSHRDAYASILEQYDDWVAGRGPQLTIPQVEYIETGLEWTDEMRTRLHAPSPRPRLTLQPAPSPRPKPIAVVPTPPAPEPPQPQEPQTMPPPQPTSPTSPLQPASTVLVPVGTLNLGDVAAYLQIGDGALRGIIKGDPTFPKRYAGTDARPKFHPQHIAAWVDSQPPLLDDAQRRMRGEETYIVPAAISEFQSQVLGLLQEILRRVQALETAADAKVG